MPTSCPSSRSDRLSGSVVQPSLDHNDLHAWNILGEGTDPRFYDWGDGVLAHPFASMLALGWVPMSDSARTRLRDAYLGPFGDLAPHDELVGLLGGVFCVAESGEPVGHLLEAAALFEQVVEIDDPAQVAVRAAAHDVSSSAARVCSQLSNRSPRSSM